MKTVFINCSPKKRFCASGYFLSLQRLFTSGEKVTEKLLSPADYKRILSRLADADAVVFCLPLYVDGVPSHVLRFLETLEGFSRENGLGFRVYCIANNGFIEGRQNEPLMQVFEHFCTRAGLRWCGGVGIGGGMMLNVTRIFFLVDIALLLVNMVLSGVQGGGFFPAEPLQSFAVSALVLLYFNLGVLVYLAQMGGAIGRGEAFDKKYTRILIPAILFLPITDVFFTVVSVLKGGFFRGWLAGKKPDEGWND